jgi:hypothetical protein
MNSKHVYIGNYYSFSTPSSKYKTFAMEGFLIFFMKFFINIGKGTNIG